MKKLQAFGITILVLIVLAAAGILGYVSWYFANDRTSTINTAYINDLSYAPDGTYFIEVNYLTNEFQNGKEVFEARFNYYTDAAMPQTEEELASGEFRKNVYSTGIQVVGEGQTIPYKRTVAHWGIGGWGRTVVYGNEFIDPYFYDSSNGTSFKSWNDLTFRDEWIVDFDGTLGKLTQRGWDKRFPITSLLARVDYEALFVEDFLVQLKDVARGSENGLSVKQFNLSKWFVGHELVFDENGKSHFKDSETADSNWMFINVKVNRNSNGMIDNEQSLFSAVNGDFDWTLNDVNFENYWTTKAVYNLTVSDFDFVKHDSQFHFLARINETAANFLDKFFNMYINVVIDLSAVDLINNGIILYGLQADPFRGLRVGQITITSNTPATLHYTDPLPGNTILSNVTLVPFGGGA